MCNAIEGDEDIPTIPRKTIFSNLNLTKCNKCREQRPSIVLRNKDAYCQSCFLHGTSHKFKGLLGKHRLVQPNENILIIHNCGHPTTALLHLIRTGLDIGANKKLRFIPIILCIENFYDLLVQERQGLLQNVEDECKRFNFPVYFISFSEYVLNPANISDFLKTKAQDVVINSSHDTKLKEIFQNSREKVEILHRRLSVKVARLVMCKTIFATDIAVDFGTQILTNVALGRGGHLPLDVGLCDTREDVKIIRPLRFYEMKELAFYNIFNKQTPVNIPLKNATINPYSSVHNLMKKFILDLQNNFPATIMTIVRTTDKLAIDKSMENNKRCEFCKAPIETKNTELTSFESTNFSHYISTIKENVLDCDEILSSEEKFDKLRNGFQAYENDNYCISCSKMLIC